MYAVLYFSCKISYNKSMKATISQKGQVTVPKACRDRLGLKAGTVLDFETRDGMLIARKSQPEDPFLKWRGRGKLPKGRTVDEYLKKARG